MKVTFTKTLGMIMLFVVVSSGSLFAQFTTQIGTSTSVSTLYGPFYKPSATNVFDFSRYSYLFTESELAALDSGSLVTQIAFYKANTNRTLIDANLNIYMQNVNKTALLSGVNWGSVISGATQVLSTSTFQVGDSTGWIMIPVTPFVYTGGDLQISIDFDISAVDPPVDGGLLWRFSNAPGLQTIGAFGSSAPNNLDIIDPVNPNRRPNLLLSYSPPPSNDASIAAITSAVPSLNAGPFSIDVTILNTGGSPIDSVDLYASVNLELGGTKYFGPIKYSGPVIGINKTSDTVTIAIDTLLNGNYTICAWTQNPNGAADKDPSNDTLCVQLISIGPKPVPYSEDFESFIVGSPGVFLENWTTEATGSYQWYVEDATGANENSLSTGPFYDHTNFNSSGGIYLYTEASSGSAGDTATLISPEISLSGISFPVLNFWYHMYGDSIGSLHFDINDGSGWVNDFIPPVVGEQQTAGSDSWIEIRDTLTAYIGSTIQIRFRASKKDGLTGDICIDDFKVTDPTVPDLSISQVLAPTNGCDLSSGEFVFVTIDNLGEVAGVGPVSVNVSVSGAINSGPFNATFNNPVNPGASKFYLFPTPVDLSAYGEYEVTISVDQAGDINPLNNSVTVSIENVPSVSTFPYSESFESGNGGWSSGGTNSTWALGTPGHKTISGASEGSQAWTTGGIDTTFLNDNGEAGFYNPSENSSVVSPCLNFGTLLTAEILFDIWWNAENSFDGAVLQGSTDFGETWITVGALGEPDNWYNDNTISGAPGGSLVGWTGREATANGSGGWVTARHDLNAFIGEPEVFLRIAFGADGSIQDDGFAFDNILIRQISLNDLGVVGIETSEGCNLSTNEAVSITIQNYASVTVVGPESIPVALSVNNGPVILDTVIIDPLIIAGGQASFNLSQTVDLSAAGIYTIKAWTNRPGDGKTNNDTATFNFESLQTPSAPSTKGDTLCGSGGSATLTASGFGDVFLWYDSATGGNIVGEGDTFVTTVAGTTTLFCEASSQTNEFVGAIDTSIGDNSCYNSRQGLLLNVIEEVTLKSAYFVPCSAENRTFNVYDENDVLYSTTTIFMDTAGRYELNLQLPAGTGILVEAESSSNLIRNFSGASYPYVSPSGNVTITGTDNSLANYYYFFYNMELLIPGCTSDSRSATTVLVSPPITTSVVGTNVTTTGGSDGTADLTVSGGTPPYTYFWSNTATTEDVSGLTAGSYSVTVTDAAGCTAVDMVDINQPDVCGPGSIVSGLTATNTRLTRTTLQWNQLPGTETYEIRGKRIAPVVDPSNTELSVPGTQNTILATNLNSGTTYEWEVRGVCDASGTIFTPWSGLAQFTTGACVNPPNTTTLNVTATSATLDWDPIAYPSVIGYRVIGGVQGDFSTTLDIGNKNTTQLNVGSLPGGTTFNWGVIAACQDGPGVFVFSNAATATINLFTTLGPTNKLIDESVEDFLIYPNPTSEFLYVRIPDRIVDEDITFVIMDVSGKEIIRTNDVYGSIDVSNLSQGFYEVRFITENEEYIDKLMIVR